MLISFIYLLDKKNLIMYCGHILYQWGGGGGGGLVQERRNFFFFLERHNSIANALELRLSCTNPAKWW